MRSLAYLTYLKAKNRLLEIIRKPSQLILIIVFLLFIGVSAFGTGESSSAEYRNIKELYAIILALYSFVFVMVSKNGFHNGASMFSMSDVNLIFTAPLKSNAVLSFGLVQQLTRSIMLGIFILYQSSTIRELYDVSFLGLVFIFIGYAVTVFLSQMLAMLIYSFTCSDDSRKRKTKTIYYFIIGSFIVSVFLIAYLENGISLISIAEALNKKIFLLFPISGVVCLGVSTAIGGQYIYTAISIALVCLLVALYYLLVSKLNTDFYEDVLSAAEASFSAITARKEGKVAENAPRNIKVGKTGLEKGFGANAVSYKHKVENRRSRNFLLNTMSFVPIAFSAVLSFVIPEAPVAVFIFNAYLLSFSVGASRWAKELNYPYIYLIPEPPAKKLFYMIKGDLPSLALESILCFIPVYFLCGISIKQAISMMAARFSFGVLVIGINLVLQRLFGSSDKGVLVYLVYVILIFTFTVPSAVVAVLIGMALPLNTEMAYLAFTVVNIVLSVVVLICTRNILQYAEYNNK